MEEGVEKSLDALLGCVGVDGYGLEKPLNHANRCGKKPLTCA